jgi:hypothetical protein
MFLFIISPAGHLLRSRFRWYEEDAQGGARLLFRDSLTLAPQCFYGPVPDLLGRVSQVQSVDLSRAYPDFYHESPHNILLDVLTAQGVLGLLAFQFHRARIPCAWQARKRIRLAGFWELASRQSRRASVHSHVHRAFFYLVAAMLVALRPRLKETRIAPDDAGGAGFRPPDRDWAR